VTIVARKTPFSQWIWLVVAILVESVSLFAFVWCLAMTPPGSPSYFWLPPAACVFLLGPLQFCLYLSDLRKRGIAMYLDREGISWDLGSTPHFWLPFEKHFRRVKWDEILGVKILHDKWVGGHEGPVILIGVNQCESVTSAHFKAWYETLLTTVGRPPWKNTIPVYREEIWLWDAKQVVAQIEQTLGDKNLREQWGDPTR
jgi:hypothetical protein